jgi:hypothetical protein
VQEEEDTAEPLSGTREGCAGAQVARRHTESEESPEDVE